MSSKGKKENVQVRVQLDDTTTINEGGLQAEDDEYFIPLSGFKRVTLTAGTHNIDIDWKGMESDDTAKIRRARICVRKVT